MVHVDHIKNIAENKFLPENIVKLSTDFAAAKQSRKYIKMGEIDLLTRDDDATASDIKDILQLVQSFMIYCQIVLHFAHPSTYADLVAAFHFYTDRLIKHALVRTFESVRTFHFIFHKKCIVQGVTDPASWKEVDSSMKSQYLIVRPAPSNPNGKGPNAAANKNSPGNQGSNTEGPICFKFNSGNGCTMTVCRYRHICRTCGGPHSGISCKNNPNNAPVGKRN